MADPAKNKAPMVLVYIGDDDPARGNSHGFVGIGRMLAKKIRGDFHYLTDKDLETLYPDVADVQGRLKRYFRDHKEPDILFSRRDDVCKSAMSKNPVMAWRDVNETICRDYMDEKELVCHHLTPEILTEEGRKFRENYSQLTHPLVAVLMAGKVWRMAQVRAFAKSLVSKCAAYPDASIFLCTGRRTDGVSYQAVMLELERQIRESGLQQQIKLAGYEFLAHVNDTKTHNPYIGLLNESDHAVVYGSSFSLVSEVLATGKTVFLHDAGIYKKLTRTGLARQFNSCAAGAPFETARIKPVNLTEKITDKMALHFTAKASKNPFKKAACLIGLAYKNVRDKLGV